MEFRNISRWLIYLGVALVTAGIIFWLLSKIFTGNFPGTLKIQLGEKIFIFPILLSVILSIVLTFLLNLIAYLFRH